MEENKIEKKDTRPRFSYSRISTYKNCPFGYDLKYNQKKFCGGDSLDALVGTLIHYIEEQISKAIMKGETPDYAKLKDDLYNIDIPKKNPYDREGGIHGATVLASRFSKAFFTPSEKTGRNFMDKVRGYEANITRQEDFMKNHPELEICAVELPFEFEYEGHIIQGYIDRLLKYKEEDRYAIYDIKTRDRLFDQKDVPTPLQHVVYCLAVQNHFKLKEPPTECFYDLVFIQEMQQVGTKGFIKRGMTQLTKLFKGIESGDYPPKPTPLCYWCDYSNTNPNITETGKNECPYYSLWTRANPTHDNAAKWEGPDKTQVLITKLKTSNADQEVKNSMFII